MNIEVGNSYCFVPYRGHCYRRQYLKCTVLRVLNNQIEVLDEHGEKWLLSEDDLMPIQRPY